MRNVNILLLNSRCHERGLRWRAIVAQERDRHIQQSHLYCFWEAVTSTKVVPMTYLSFLPKRGSVCLSLLKNGPKSRHLMVTGPFNA